MNASLRHAGHRYCGGANMIGTFIYYGHGMNLGGEIGAATALLLAFVIFGVQVVAANVWLQHFRYGPLEWFWRCATFGKWQPIRAAMPPAMAASG